MELLITNSGKAFKAEYAAPSTFSNYNNLNALLLDTTLAEIQRELSVSENTKKLTLYYCDEDGNPVDWVVYEGYTTLDRADDKGKGSFGITLKRGTEV